MKTKKENSKNLPKNDDGTDLRRLPLLLVAGGSEFLEFLSNFPLNRFPVDEVAEKETVL